MSLEVWLAFVVAAAALCVIPGPTVIAVIGQAVGNGKKSVLPLLAGVLLGDFVAMSLSLLGLGAVLATSVSLFLLLKWIGAVYLIYLGIKIWRTNPDIESKQTRHKLPNKTKIFKSVFWVTVLNPKSIAFFVALFPQFINPEFGAARQLCILMMTFLFIVAVCIFCYSIFAVSLRHVIESYRARKMLNRASGFALVGAGLFTAAWRRE